MDNNKILHAYGAGLIQEGCDLLCSGEEGGEGGGKPYRNKTIVCGTACNIFHSFFQKVSFQTFDILLTAATSCLLASKTHDSPSFVRSVVLVFDRIQQRRQHPSWTYPMYLLGTRHQIWCTSLRQMEAILLKELSFHLYPFMEHPQTFLPFIATEINLSSSKDRDMIQYAYNYMNDAQYTTLCIDFPPQVIAVAAVVSASRKYQKKLPKEFAATFGAGDYPLVEQIMEELYKTIKPAVPRYILSMASDGWQVPLLPPKLSKGVVADLVATKRAGESTTFTEEEEAVNVQVLQIKRMEHASGKDRYKMIVSDGTSYINAVLDTKLNCIVENEKMKEFTIVQINDGVVKDVAGRKLWIITSCNVIFRSKAKINVPVRYDLLPRENNNNKDAKVVNIEKQPKAEKSKNTIKSRFQPKQVRSKRKRLEK
jgi:hypothetical protein